MIKLVPVLGAFCSVVSALQQEEVRMNLAKHQGNFYQFQQQQQQQRQLPRHHYHQLLQTQTQPWGVRPQTEHWGGMMEDQAHFTRQALHRSRMIAQAPRRQQPYRSRAPPLQLLQQEPAVEPEQEATAAQDGIPDGTVAQDGTLPEQDPAALAAPSQKAAPQPETAMDMPQPEQEASALPVTPEPASQPEPAAEQASSSAEEAVGMYKLRLCNAYAWPESLEMRRVEEPKLVEYPLPYKACHDYLLPLREGDQLQFRAGDVSIGTFSVRGLPDDKRSLLLLIPHRRDANSAAVAFDSHIFRGGGSSQVAVIDTYRGPEQANLMIEEPTRQEELRFNSVVAVTPGSYKFTLAGMGQSNARTAAASAQLAVKAEENYVVLRVGTGQWGDDKYPQELVVFPDMSGSVRAAASAVILVLVGLVAGA